MLLFTKQIMNTAEGPQAEGCGNGSWESVCERQAERSGLITAVRAGGNDVAHGWKTIAVTTGVKHSG
jgi:hypothetical protein